jgi:hypothetical protein
VETCLEPAGLGGDLQYSDSEELARQGGHKLEVVVEREKCFGADLSHDALIEQKCLQDRPRERINTRVASPDEKLIEPPRVIVGFDHHNIDLLASRFENRPKRCPVRIGPQDLDIADAAHEVDR